MIFDWWFLFYWKKEEGGICGWGIDRCTWAPSLISNDWLLGRLLIAIAITDKPAPDCFLSTRARPRCFIDRTAIIFNSTYFYSSLIFCLIFFFFFLYLAISLGLSIIVDRFKLIGWRKWRQDLKMIESGARIEIWKRRENLKTDFNFEKKTKKL